MSPTTRPDASATQPSAGPAITMSLLSGIVEDVADAEQAGQVSHLIGWHALVRGRSASRRFSETLRSLLKAARFGASGPWPS